MGRNIFRGNIVLSPVWTLGVETRAIYNGVNRERRDDMIGRNNFLKVGLIVLFVSLGLQQKGLTEERYTVKSGDTLYEISKSFGISVEALKNANGLGGNSIRPKQVLMIPSQRERKTGESPTGPSGLSINKASTEIPKKPAIETDVYVVQKGDSLYRISKKVGHSIEEIKKMNGLQTIALKIGQTLHLPKSEILLNDGIEELGDAEEVITTTTLERGKEEQTTSHFLGKWSNSEERNLFVKVVKTFLGVPYRLGGSTLKGIDCSAFVKKIYEIFNVDLPRTAREQSKIGKRIEKGELEEGDLVFFQTRRANNAHVGIYIGGNKFIHASSRNREVKIDQLDLPYFNQRFIRGVRVKELERES